MTASALVEKLALNASYLAAKQLIPAFVYGTAWKKDATSDLVYQALCNGFTAIDTANQPKHYKEDLVGAGLRRAIVDGKVKRSDIYLQTKFTSVAGQDPNDIPYDSKLSITEQVRTSIESSLQHLRLGEDSASVESSYLDTVVLHSPLPTLDDTLEAWHTLEEFVPKKVRMLGISNCPLFTLMDLFEKATVKPVIVQNRFHAATKFDISVRKFCAENSIIYQSFWTLTANPRLVWSDEVVSVAKELGISMQAALYGLVLSLGNIVILNGTKSLQHMQTDFDALISMRKFAEEHPAKWSQATDRFKTLIGQSLG